MNRLEEFLQNLDLKNKAMLYLSVLIVGIIVYYNFNYNVLNSKIQNNSKKIVNLKKRLNISPREYNNKLSKLKKEYKNLKIVENEKLQDLSYLNRRLKLSHLNINDKNFYTLLENILSKSYDFDLTPSFYIQKDFGNFKKYIVDINGSFTVCSEKKLFDLIKFLESRKYVVNIDTFNLDKNTSNFFIRYNIWGIK